MLYAEVDCPLITRLIATVPLRARPVNVMRQEGQRVATSSWGNSSDFGATVGEPQTVWGRLAVPLQFVGVGLALPLGQSALSQSVIDL